jgi:hypothetical protein
MSEALISEKAEADLTSLAKQFEATPPTELGKLQRLGEQTRPREREKQKPYAEKPPTIETRPKQPGELSTRDLAEQFHDKLAADKQATADRDEAGRQVHDAEVAATQAEAEEKTERQAAERAAAYVPPELEALREKWKSREPLSPENREEFGRHVAEFERVAALGQRREAAGLAYLNAIGIEPKSDAAKAKLGAAIRSRALAMGYTDERIGSADDAAVVALLKEIGKDELRSIARGLNGSKAPPAARVAPGVRKFEKSGSVEDLGKLFDSAMKARA